VTMETILNLIWLGITLVAIWLWRFRWVASRPSSRRDARLEAVAMVCVLALLFPVISLTDDLHPEVVPVDSISSKRNHCLLAASCAQAEHAKVPSSVRSWVALVSHSPEEIKLVFSAFVLSRLVSQASSICLARSTRSPPSLA
jgi:hypothetical protein